jgi:nucleoside-diphosphate-sugar epimerase
MRVLVMGGTRLMGEAAVRHLLAAGHDVTIFNRGSRQVAWADDVSWILGDRDTPEGIGRLAGRHPVGQDHPVWSVALQRAIAEGGEPETSARDNLSTLRIVEALYRSGATDQVVRLDTASEEVPE